ncbi:MAG: DNA-directed RNA polymerase subunit beta' [Eubacterium sp.]|nr:DNA-directed RNA polymerase subunit beta' [Eubacterium sp.]
MSVMNNQQAEQSVNFDAIKIGLASPEMIRKWSHGEVTKPETINYRTLKPEKDGLFCERIFGPSKDWECHCGKYKKERYKGVVCDKCGVEVTKASVRRERMGHIELSAPVSHIWYFKGIPSRMGLILDMSPKDLEKVLYFASYVVLDSGNTTYLEKTVISDAEYRRILDEYKNAGDDIGTFRVGMGAEAVKELLQKIDLEKESETLRESLDSTSGQKKARVIKRLEVVEAFRQSGNRPEWMILDAIPVIPPDIRPMVQLDGGRFATSDLNDLYRRIINRNNRLKKLIDMKAPDLIVRNEKRMMQEAVDALIDNGRRGNAVTTQGNRKLKSLSHMLRGKQGRFRQNLLGKRVDYSGRSVIVVGPELKIYQCGLPKEMAIELFKPFVMKELVADGKASNIKSAKKKIEKMDPEVWDVLESVIKEHPVMLNRAPTLHRLGIQAFEPILVEGKAIKLHPLVCTAFNADFDGDQMAVHLPLSQEAQAECRFLLLSPNNLLKPSDGAPVAVPSQDMVLGIYYLTMEKEGEKGEGKCFKSENEAFLAYENHIITLHSKIRVRRSMVDEEGVRHTGIVDCTAGRLLFNEIIPQNLGIVDRSQPENLLKLEVDYQCGKKQLKDILDRCINVEGTTKTAEVLDNIKSIGYKYSTIGALSVSISDMNVPKEKTAILEKAQKDVEDLTRQYHHGFMTDEERHRQVVEVWSNADTELASKLKVSRDKYNNINMMADSGARGSDQQIKQLVCMRGLMADTSGRTIELPIKSNFREGLDVLEYFISAHGARKGLSDTALRTADSGYLTRRLVDVSQELIIRESDCCEGTGKIPGMYVSAIIDTDINGTADDDKKNEIEELKDRISGRYAAEDYYDQEGNLIVKANHLITSRRADALIKADYSRVKIRNMLTCKSKNGACAKCYGANLATGKPVQVGEAVGIIAAQSIGEPGTQLTMRTFHTGGVAGNDITQGLPRVEELFEARKPKGLAIITEIAGRPEVKESSEKREITVVNDETGESKDYLIPYGSRFSHKVNNGEYLEAGDQLTEGSVNPHDILKIKGVEAVQDYMMREVQRVYRLQGVDINDKHIEIIVRQMLKKVRIDEAGDSSYLPGTLVDNLDLEEVNEKLIAEGLEPASGEQTLLGITKASLATNSFLAAASFQETTKVLTDAAIKGKIDPLIGLKENVLLGKLIPAGTGLKKYRNLSLVLEEDECSQPADDENGAYDYDADPVVEGMQDMGEPVNMEQPEGMPL